MIKTHKCSEISPMEINSPLYKKIFNGCEYVTLQIEHVPSNKCDLFVVEYVKKVDYNK